MRLGTQASDLCSSQELGKCEGSLAGGGTGWQGQKASTFLPAKLPSSLDTRPASWEGRLAVLDCWELPSTPLWKDQLKLIT